MEDKEIEVKIGKDYQYSNLSKNITSTFFVVINGGNMFPDDSWFDFPVTVISWWCAELINASDKSNANFKLYFMDGPYYINCRKIFENVNMEFIDNQKNEDKIILNKTLTFRKLMDEIYSSALELVTHIKEMQIDELKDMKILIEQLSKMHQLF